MEKATVDEDTVIDLSWTAIANQTHNTFASISRYNFLILVIVAHLQN
jgi:hypothetical protein